MIALLLRFYPARWRARYGDEFAAMLEERPLSPFDVADILLGAVDAQLHLRGLGSASPSRKGSTMSLRIGGYAAIGGAALWFLGLLLGSADDATGETDTALTALTFLSVVAGTLFLLVALVGLSAFQARSYPRLVWASFAIPATGAVISVAGMVLTSVLGDRPLIGEASAWYLWLAGVIALIIGSGLFGLATWRTRTLSRPGGALLVMGALGMLPLLYNLASGGDEASLFALFMAAILAFAAGWLALGVSAIRADRRPSTSLEGASL